MLTVIEIRALKPKDAPYKVADEKVRPLLVQPSGSPLWRFKYRFGGIEKKLSFGRPLEVSLQEARALRGRGAGQDRPEIDPAAEKRQAIVGAALAAGNRFRLIADDQLGKMETGRKAAATL